MTEREYKTGAELLDACGCQTREKKLEQACKALMEQLNGLHICEHKQDLSKLLTDQTVTCSCADAYRMGEEALKL